MSVEESSSFALVLRRARQAAGLTQEELAERAQLSWRLISDLERGVRRLPRRHTVALLAGALLLADDQRVRFETAAMPVENGPGSHTPAAFTRTPEAPHLIGRAREQVLVRLALAEAVAGQGCLVLIGGQAGVGKTALVDALCQESTAQGTLVLTGRCHDLTETPPYGPWSEVLSGIAAGTARQHQPADLTRRAPAAGITSRGDLFAHVLATLETAARAQPLVVVLDDLHWADPSTLDLLRFVARKLAALPILLLVTYRDDELTSRQPLYAALPQLVREAPTVRVDLRALHQHDTQALVAQRYRLDEQEARRLAQYLQQHAEGNPFFAMEVLRTLESDGHVRVTDQGWSVGALDQFRVPPLLRQVIEGRLAHLDGATRRLLEIAAVLGQHVPLALWALVAAVDEERLLIAVEQAIAACLVEALPEGTAIRFSHALVRAALYEGLIAPRRRRWHGLIGEALASQREPIDPDAVAYHFQQAADRRAAEWLLRAGERAQRAYAWLSAAARFEAALALLDDGDAARRGWLLFRLVMLRRLDDTRHGVARLEEAERLGATVGDRALVAAAVFNRGLIRSMAGDVARGVPELEGGVQALAALAPADRARLQTENRLGDALDGANGQGELTLWLAEVGRYAEAAALGERLTAPGTTSVAGEAITDDSRGDAYYGRAWSHAAMGQPDEAHRAFARARAAFQAIGHRFMEASALWFELILVVLPYEADRLGSRARHAAALTQAMAQVQDATSRPPRLCLAELLILEGSWTEAHALLMAEEELTVMPFSARLLGPLARARGERELAWTQVHRIYEQGPGTSPGAVVSYAVGLQRLAADLALDEGDLGTARAWLEAHDRWLAWSGSLLGRAEALLGWAAYYRALDEPARAREAAAAALSSASAPRQPLVLLAAHRLLGEVETAAARWTAAAAHLRAALELAEACAAPYERALTLLALAALRQVRGDRPAALSLLESVRALCAPLSARPALARAEALAAQWQTAPPRAAAAPAGLTPRERAVLRLLATGLSNAAIAQRLMVSPRTVDAHLVHIYGKLGVSSRSAAVAFAIDRGLR